MQFKLIAQLIDMEAVPEEMEELSRVASGAALSLDQILNTVIGSNTENNIAKFQLVQIPCIATETPKPSQTSNNDVLSKARLQRRG